ncbi:MAG: spermidine synthase [Myxococcota bacterium]|nr:spermidine synthase [Myxococcota bacterium]
MTGARWILCGVFFVSGAAGLIFEALWFRQAGLAFGNGVTAASLVLASFMAGLALGSGLVAAVGPRLKYPLRLYAALELLIAGGGVALVWVLPDLGVLLAPVERSLGEQPVALSALRFGLAFVLLLLPATAMGATLPLLVAALRARDASFGSALGALYGWNTLGAVVGALAVETVVVGALGVRGAAMFAGGLDVLAGAVAWGIARRAGPAALRADHAPGPVVFRRGAGALLLAAALAGASLLALEVVWFRLLRLFVPTGGLAFALMLASVLAGLGFGGALAGLWLRRRPAAWRWGAAVAWLAGALVSVLYGDFSRWVGPPGGPLRYEPRALLELAAVLTLPVSVLSGVLVPLVGAALRERVAPDLRAAGLLTLCNTLGAAGGSLVAGFVLLPALGMERAIFVLAAVYGAVGLLLVVGAGGGGRALPAALGLGAALLLFPFGKMERDYLRFPVERFAGREATTLQAVREGRTETALLLRAALDGESVHHRLVTDGYSMAGTTARARRYMKLYVYWPLALQPTPRRVLLISYGAGSTARALAAEPGIERVDVVDLSREILELSPLLYPRSGEDPLEDPRFRVHVGDGRHFLQVASERYDLITGEPPPPKAAGVVNLYTREYFALVRERLAEGGVHTYWLPVHNLTEDEARGIVRAYCDVFPDCSLWNGSGYDWMLVGSRGGRWDRDPNRFRGLWEDSPHADELARLGLERPEQLGATFLADAEQLSRWTDGAAPLVDDRPLRLGHEIPGLVETRAVFAPWLEPEAARRRFEASAFVRAAWPPDLREDSLAYFDAQALLESPVREADWPGSLQASFARLHRALSETDLRVPALWLTGTDDDYLAAVERRIVAGAPERDYALLLGRRELAARRYGAAARRFESARAVHPNDRVGLRLELYALCLAGRGEVAAERAGRLGIRPAERAWWAWLREVCGL